MHTSLHPNAQHVADVLAAAGVSGEVRMFTASAATAAEAAGRIGCEVGAIANSLVFRADEDPVLILASGAHRVDTGRVAVHLEVSAIKRADPDFVREATGQVIGAVAPIGHPRPLRTLVDATLWDYETVWAAAGHRNAVFPTTFEELLRITGGTPAEVGA